MKPHNGDFSRFLVIGLLVVMAGLLLGLSPQHYFSWLDKPLLLAFRDPASIDRLVGPPWLSSAVRDVTALGSTVILIMSALAFTGLLVVSRMYRTAGIFAAATTVAYFIMSISKQMYGRVRPGEVPHLDAATGFSFPSGHAMMSTFIYFSMLMVMHPFLNRPQKIWLSLVATGLALLIGFSRILLGVHYPSDVLAGWCIGSGMLLCLHAILRADRIRKPL